MKKPNILLLIALGTTIQCAIVVIRIFDECNENDILYLFLGILAALMAVYAWGAYLISLKNKR